MLKRALLAACALMALTALAPAGSDTTRLGVPGRSNATPSIAADGSFVAVAWGAVAGTQADVFMAISRNGGQTFGAPARVNQTAGEARLSGEMPPRVAFDRHGAGDPGVVVLWTARDDGTAIRIARSRNGTTFEPAVTLEPPGTAGDRGWPALALDTQGTAHALWLDHRGLARAGAPHVHADHKTAAPRDAVAMAQLSGLYYAASGLRKPPLERELAKGVCYCCKTALAAGKGGTLVAAWRQVYPGNIRDIAFSVSRDSGRSFSESERVSEDKWALDGCPDDGPALALDARGTAHLVWPTVIAGANVEGGIFYAASRDGRSFTPRIRIPTLGSPKPSHPQIAVDASGRIVIAWDELVGGTRVAALREVRPANDGTIAFGPIVELTDAGRAIYPVVAAASTGLVAAWTSGPADTSVIAVRRVVLP
jgi:hypothetical protein